LVYCFPHVGGGEDHVVAVKSGEAIMRGLVYANVWLKDQGMGSLTLEGLFKKA